MLNDKKKQRTNRSLNKKSITDEDYEQAKRVSKNFKLKNLVDYHDLYIQKDMLLLGDIFENFGIYKLDPTEFLPVPLLVWQKCLKNSKLKSSLLTGIDMVQMIVKGLRGGTCHGTYNYAKANNKYMKDYIKKESPHLMYWDGSRHTDQQRLKSYFLIFFSMGRKRTSKSNFAEKLISN